MKSLTCSGLHAPSGFSLFSPGTLPLCVGQPVSRKESARGEGKERGRGRGSSHQACERPTRDKEVDARRRVLEVEGEMLRQRLDGRFGRVVSRVARRVGDALLAARDDDGTRPVPVPLTIPIPMLPFLEIRHVGVQPVDHAVQIRIEDLHNPPRQSPCNFFFF